MSCYNGKTYEEIKVHDVENVINNVLCDASFPATLSARIPNLALKIVSEKRISTDPNLIVFENCVYDAEQDLTHRFSPKYASLYKVDYKFDRSVPLNLWQLFLDTVLPNKEKQRILQEFVGMIYIDRTKISIEKCLIMVGGGANGKSVVYNVLKALVGERYVSSFRPNQLATDIGVYGTIGKRLNCCSEVQVTDAMTGALKPLISHEPVEGKGLYKEHVQVRCPPIIFILNEMPPMTDSSFGFWRRMLRIDFDVTVPKHQQNKTLARKIIQTELPAIFNWAMEGRKRLLDNYGEFTYCEDMEQKLNECRLENNPVLSYVVSNNYSPYPQYVGQRPVIVKASDLKDSVGNISDVLFGREMKRLKFKKVKKGGMCYEVYENKAQMNN